MIFRDFKIISKLQFFATHQTQCGRGLQGKVAKLQKFQHKPKKGGMYNDFI